MHSLSPHAAATLAHFATDGDWTRLISEGELRVLNRPLEPGQAVGLARQGDTLWVILDMSQGDALAQLRDLIMTWPVIALRHPLARGPLQSEVDSLVG